MPVASEGEEDLDLRSPSPSTKKRLTVG